MGEVLGFDLELYDELPESGIWQDRPPRLACIGCTDGTAVKFWHGECGKPMEPWQLTDCARWLWGKINTDRAYLATFNGASFDIPLLWHWLENERAKTFMRSLAAHHTIDLILVAIKAMGYGLGMDTMAKALGVPGKLDGVSGKEAPKLWRDGECEKVLEYLGQDCKASRDVYEALLKRGHLTGWTTKRGTMSHQVFSFPIIWDNKRSLLRIMTPHELRSWNPPLNSSFTPWDTRRYYEWMPQNDSCADTTP